MRYFLLCINLFLLVTCSSHGQIANESSASNGISVREKSSTKALNLKESSNTDRRFDNTHPQSSTDACGDATVMARFDKCLKAATETACVAAGGSWEKVGLSQKLVCSCPTGQGDCPCVRSTDCRRASDGLGACTAPIGNSDSGCKAVKKGTCAGAYPIMGCRCWFNADGDIQPICVD